MAYSLNKMWTAMAASLIAAAGIVSAAPNYYDSDVNYDYGQAGSVRPALDGCGSWFFSAEALYWKAAEDGLAYGTANSSTVTSELNSLVDIDVLEPRFRWDWGFRLGAGYDFSCGWDFRAYWTHYHGKAHGGSENDFDLASNPELFTTWGTTSGTAGFDLSAIDSSWKLRLDLADFELGREFCCGPCVSLRPHIGLRAVWLKQRYEVVAVAPETITVGEVVTDVTALQDIHLKSEFEGLGLRGGLDTQWNIGCGFSLYGNAAISAIYGTFHNHTDEYNVFFASPTSLTSTTLEFDQADHYHACRFISDLALGLRWQQAYCCDSVILTLQVGWEHHLFVNQNRFEDFVSPTNLGARNPNISRGDLCLHGWTFGAKLDF